VYYLDTSCIRPLIKRVEETDLKDRTCTSILTLIELTSGFKNLDDLHKRAALAKRIIESGMTVDYEPAENKLINAFPGLSPLPNWEEPINLLVETLQEVNAVDEVESEITKNNLMDFWIMLSTYDKWTTQNFANEFFQLIQQVKKKAQGQDVPWNNIESNINSWARSFSQDETINPGGLSSANLIESFNGSASIYLQVGNYYLDLVYGGRVPGRNDYLDLQHFAYLSNNDFTMVTSDGLMIEIGNVVCNDRMRTLNQVE
jgi:hypothetical protein